MRSETFNAISLTERNYQLTAAANSVLSPLGGCTQVRYYAMQINLLSIKKNYNEATRINMIQKCFDFIHVNFAKRRIRPPNEKKEVPKVNLFGSVSDSLGRLAAACPVMLIGCT